MEPWSGDLVADGSDDIVLRSPDKEVLRLRKDGTFLVNGRPVEQDDQVVLALRRWLTGSEEALPIPAEAAGRVLTVSAPKPPRLPPLTRTKAAHEALKAALKEKENTRNRAVGALAKLLTTFQTAIKPIVIDLGETAKSVANQRLTTMFDVGGYVNTISIDGIFGLELNSASYITYNTGTRKHASPQELAAYLIDSHPNFDVEAGLNKIAAEVEATADRITKAFEGLNKIGAVASAMNVRIEMENAWLQKALPGEPPPKELMGGGPEPKALTG
jgi:hypothetical protein